MDLSIIIVSWNTRKLLDRCLETVEEAIRTSDVEETEIFVVDNGSTDGSVGMLRGRPGVLRIIVNDENIGFARANNQAIRRTSGRYILLLNPDTELGKDSIGAMIRFLENNPSVGAVGPRQTNPDGSLQPSCFPLPTLPREFWRLFHLDSIRAIASYPMQSWDHESPRQVESLMGACLCLRREALDGVGLLDEDYFMYSEEIDLCYRLRTAGWTLFWVPAAVVAHHGGQSTKQAQTQMFLHLYKSKILYFRKNGGGMRSVAYKFILIGASLARLALAPIAWLQGRLGGPTGSRLASNYLQLLRSLPGM